MLPDGLGDAVAEFKDGFQPSEAAGRAVDHASVAAEGVEDATSAKTLATE